MTESREHIPAALAKAMRGEDYSEVMRVASDLAENDPEAAVDALWSAANDTPVMRRILAYFLVRQLEGAAADATRLWLLVTPTTDAMTFVNVLSGLSVLAVEGAGIPSFCFSHLGRFLHDALKQRDRGVRVSVLDFLRDYSDVEGVPRLLGQASARQLADELETKLRAIVEDEEVNELAEVLAILRADSIPERPPVPLTEIEQLLSKVERTSSNEELIQFVREQRLQLSARWQARHLHRPVITVRVPAFSEGVADNAFLRNLLNVADLLRMEHLDTNGKWIAAPAASIAKHLQASEATTRATLDSFKSALAVAAEGGDPSALYQFPPRQAQALAAMLMASAETSAHAQIIFTEPDPAKPQLVLEFRAPENRSKSWLRILEEIRERGEREPEVYSEEVPQANTVLQVFQAVDAILRKGEVEVADIENISNVRQVNYYKQGARILGFLDSNNAPTDLAAEIGNKKSDARLRIAARAFNDSMVGRSWRAWAEQDHLADVDVETAQEFLDARARGISGSTIPRRAQTLRKWQTELRPYYRRASE